MSLDFNILHHFSFAKTIGDYRCEREGLTLRWIRMIVERSIVPRVALAARTIHGNRVPQPSREFDFYEESSVLKYKTMLSRIVLSHMWMWAFGASRRWSRWVDMIKNELIIYPLIPFNRVLRKGLEIERVVVDSYRQIRSTVGIDRVKTESDRWEIEGSTVRQRHSVGNLIQRFLHVSVINQWNDTIWITTVHFEKIVKRPQNSTDSKRNCVKIYSPRDSRGWCIRSVTRAVHPSLRFHYHPKSVIRWESEFLCF